MGANEEHADGQDKASSGAGADGAYDPERHDMAYPWPSSRLTRADMIRLSELRNRLRKPITKILHDAVGAYYQVLVQERAITPEQPGDWEWKLASVPIEEVVGEVQRRLHRAAKPPRKEPMPPVYRVASEQSKPFVLGLVGGGRLAVIAGGIGGSSGNCVPPGLFATSFSWWLMAPIPFFQQPALAGFAWL